MSQVPSASHASPETKATRWPVRFAIATAAEWLPDRERTLTALLSQIPASSRVRTFRSPFREHARLWCDKLWAWASEGDEDTVCLNDDAILCSDFPAVCEAMVEAVPDRILSLHTQPVEALALASNGARWARCYWLSGVAYLLPAAEARRLHAFWGALPWSFASEINEDVAGIMACWDAQKPCWMPIPSPVKHDTSTASSLGYDHHAMRSTCVGWEDFPGVDMTNPAYWRVDEPPPLLDNHWMPVEKLDYMRRVLKSGSPICAMCLTLEGVVSTRRDGPTVCLRCLEACHGAVEKRRAGNG